METNNQNLGALLPINESNGNQAVNARDLHKFLEIGKDFTNWMKDQIGRCDLVEGQDYEVFKFDYQGKPLAQKGESDNQHVSKTEYALSINAAKEISMMSQTEKGKQARRYFIACEEKLKEVAVKGYIPPRQRQKESFKIEDQFKAMKLGWKELGISNASKAAQINDWYAQIGVPQIAYIPSNGIKAAPTALLPEGLSIKAFQEAAERHGVITYATRKRSNGKTKRFPALTKKGLKWGENDISPKNPNEVQVHYYKDKFQELLRYLGMIP